MAARSAPRGHLCRRLCYCVEQVEEIMRTEATWIVWLPMDALALPVLPLAEPPLAEPPLAEPPLVEPVEPLPLAEPPLLVPEPPLPPDMLDEEEISEPVTSIWCPLCGVSSVSRPCRVYVDPLIAMLPDVPLPLVPAVELPAEPLVDPVELAPEAEPAPPLAEPPPLLPGDVAPLLAAAACTGTDQTSIPNPYGRS